MLAKTPETTTTTRGALKGLYRLDGYLTLTVFAVGLWLWL